MKQIDLTNSKLFKPLTEVNENDEYIDLHNDYYCNRVELGQRNELRIYFDKIDTGNYQSVVIEFKEIKIIKMSLPLQNIFRTGITIDTFYRGRFEEKAGLQEYSPDGRGYFYISFDEDYYIELFSNSVTLIYK